jgi:hypothetical protein
MSNPRTTRAEMLACILKALEGIPGEIHVTADSNGFRGVWDVPTLKPAAGPETGCRRDIIQVLKAAGHRLQTPKILDAFVAEEIEWSDRTVKRYLAELIAEGKIDHDPDDDPPGYGLRME